MEGTSFSVHPFEHKAPVAVDRQREQPTSHTSFRNRF